MITTFATVAHLLLATNALLFEPPSVRRHAPIRRDGIPVIRRITTQEINTSEWVKVGCYVDTVNPRTLPALKTVSTDAMTNTYCQQYCKSHGYSIARTEWSQECFCDNTEPSASLLMADSECDMTCTGGPEVCGGSARLTVWKYTGADPITDPSLRTYGDWKGQGCYGDSVNNRALPNRINIDGVTVESCTSACFDQGFRYAGIEFGNECYCSNTLVTLGEIGAPATSGCSMPCAANPDQTCGGPNRLNLYSYTGTSTPDTTTATQIQTSGDWTLKGCYNDDVNSRALPLREYLDTRMTVEGCTARCLSLAYTFAGVEFTYECYCSNEIESSATSGSAVNDGCTMPCEGSNSEICGGPNRLTVYEYTGTTLGAAPTELASYNDWVSWGCYFDSVTARALSPAANVVTPMTVGNCVDACNAAGLGSWRRICFDCGNALPPVAPTGGCMMKCDGDSHLCGGPNRLNVYQKTVKSSAYAFKGPDVSCVRLTTPNQALASKKFTMPSNANSPQACADKCAFGPEGGDVWLYTNMCYCFAPGTAPYSDDKVTFNQNCQGDYEYECGAFVSKPAPDYAWYYSSPFKVQARVPRSPTPVPKRKMLGTGCSSAPLWTDYGRQFTFADNSADKCWAQCAKEQLPVMLLSNKYCYCSPKNDAWTGSVNVCNQPCPGDASQICGADIRTPGNVGYFPHSIWTIDEGPTTITVTAP